MTNLEEILMKALSDVMYDTDYCYVCKHHYAKHAENCAWVAAQQRAAEGLRTIRGLTPLALPKPPRR